MKKKPSQLIFLFPHGGSSTKSTAVTDNVTNEGDKIRYTLFRIDLHLSNRNIDIGMKMVLHNVFGYVSTSPPPL